MDQDDVRTALEYCREWNTNTRHCHAAQSMLKALLRTRKPAQLAAIPGVCATEQGHTCSLAFSHPFAFSLCVNYPDEQLCSWEVGSVRTECDAYS